MTIRVVQLCGSVCVDPDDGAQLCEQAAAAMERGESVHLDFEGVTTLTSSFLNAAIGCLYGTFSREDLAARLTWSGLDATDDSLMRLVQENAVRFFTATESQRAQLAEAARHTIENR